MINKELIGFCAFLYLAVCLIIDILIYKRTKRWLLRFLPAIVKVSCIAVCFGFRKLLYGSFFSGSIPAEQDYLGIVISLILTGLWVDCMAWFFASNPFAKKTRIIFACVILGAFLLAFGVSLLEGDGGYRMSKGPNQWEMVFSGTNLQITRTMNLKNGEKILLVQIESETGTVDLVFTDEGGNILYSDKAVTNDVFTVEAIGNVTITVTVNEYRGSVIIDRVTREAQDTETS